MVLPPGRSPSVVSGLSPTYERELYEAAAELNAWINYLLHPESHDGPRIYRHKGMRGPQPDDLEMPGRVDSLEAQDHLYDTVSVLEDYAGDPDVFFRPAQAVSGVLYPIMDGTYDKLTAGCLTWREPDHMRDPGERTSETGEPVTEGVDYHEVHPARVDWLQMRLGSGLVGVVSHAAYDYEGNFLKFAVYTENSVYVVAEHLARYRAIFDKAGKDIAELMNGLTEQFANPPDDSGGGVGIELDFKSILLTGIVAAAAAVIGTVTVTTAVVLAKASVSALGDASKNGKVTYHRLNTHAHLRDTAKQYIDGVNKIEKDTADAIMELANNLGRRLSELRGLRRGASAGVPHIGDYL